MKLHLNLKYFTTKCVDGFTEIPFHVPFMSEVLYQSLLQKHNIWNDSLFTKLFFSGKQLFFSSSLQDCDYSILPFKFELNETTKEICNEASKFNKQVVALYNDDSEEKFVLPKNLILFRTSVSKSNLQNNEKVLPVFIPDHFSGFNVTDNESVSFCGYGYSYRKKWIEKIKQFISFNPIYRQGFFAPEMNKTCARKEYYCNLYQHKYAFCMRGAGNFSYRFYEALSFGRIPILIDTDTILPLNNIIKWDEHIILINERNVNELPNLLQKPYCKFKNRALWENYFSPIGFIKNFDKFIQ